MFGNKRKLEKDGVGTSPNGKKIKLFVDGEEKNPLLCDLRRIIKKHFKVDVDANNSRSFVIHKKIEDMKNMLARIRYSIVREHYHKDEHLTNYKSLLEKPGCSSISDSLNFKSEQYRSHPAVMSTLKNGYSSVYRTKREAARCARNRLREKLVKNRKNYTNHSKEIVFREDSITSEYFVEMPLSSSDDKDKDFKVSSIGPRTKTKVDIIVGNVSQYLDVDIGSKITHKWVVYIQTTAGNPHISKIVKQVRYYLDPSYKPNDVIDVYTPPFTLSRRGWGEFPIRVLLFFKTGDMPQNIIHNIVLDKSRTGIATRGPETITSVMLNIEQSSIDVINLISENKDCVKLCPHEDIIKHVDSFSTNRRISNIISSMNDKLDKSSVSYNKTMARKEDEYLSYNTDNNSKQKKSQEIAKDSKMLVTSCVHIKSKNWIIKNQLNSDFYTYSINNVLNESEMKPNPLKCDIELTETIKNSNLFINKQNIKMEYENSPRLCTEADKIMNSVTESSIIQKNIEQTHFKNHSPFKLADSIIINKKSPYNLTNCDNNFNLNQSNYCNGYVRNVNELPPTVSVSKKPLLASQYNQKPMVSLLKKRNLKESDMQSLVKGKIHSKLNLFRTIHHNEQNQKICMGNQTITLANRTNYLHKNASISKGKSILKNNIDTTLNSLLITPKTIPVVSTFYLNTEHCYTKVKDLLENSELVNHDCMVHIPHSFELYHDSSNMRNAAAEKLKNELSFFEGISFPSIEHALIYLAKRIQHPQNIKYFMGSDEPDKLLVLLYISQFQRAKKMYNLLKRKYEMEQLWSHFDILYYLQRHCYFDQSCTEILSSCTKEIMNVVDANNIRKRNGSISGHELLLKNLKDNMKTMYDTKVDIENVVERKTAVVLIAKEELHYESHQVPAVDIGDDINKICMNLVSELSKAIPEKDLVHGMQHTNVLTILGIVIKCFVEDIVRKAYACSLKNRTRSSEITTDDVFAALMSREELDILTNKYLGVKVQ